MGLEEVSYGQRIFGFATPADIAADNIQNEFNFHNRASLKWIAEDIAPGVIIRWGLFGWILVAVGELLRRLPETWRRTIRLLFPPWFIAPSFLPFAIWAYHSWIPWLWPTAIWQDQEPAECFLAFAFLAFSVFCLRDAGRVRHSPRVHSAAGTTKNASP
jgi:hypothetical protein